jgi:hypothetical protein
MMAAEAESGARLRLTGELDRIKDEFEAELQGVSDQSRIAALSIKAAARAWSAAAAASGEDARMAATRLSWLETEWDKAKGSWPAREKAALRVYFEALGRLAVALAMRRGDKAAIGELDALLSGPAYMSFARAKTVQARSAEDRVFWSNRLSALATVLVRLQCPESRQELDDVIEDMLNRAEVISRREDIHFQARMELLHLNNAQSLASMLFLMAKRGASPVTGEAEALELSWRKHFSENGSQVADLMSVTWVANAQIAFPLAWWLATDLAE